MPGIFQGLQSTEENKTDKASVLAKASFHICRTGSLWMYCFPMMTSLGEVLPLRGPLFPKFLSCCNHRNFKDIGVCGEAKKLHEDKILG